MITTVVNMKEEGSDIYIGRPSPLGNPFKIGRDGTREEVIAKYKDRFNSYPHLKQYAIDHCRGKRLGCYCKPLSCHGDIIADFLNGLEEDEKRTTSP